MTDLLQAAWIKQQVSHPYFPKQTGLKSFASPATTLLLYGSSELGCDFLTTMTTTKLSALAPIVALKVAFLAGSFTCLAHLLTMRSCRFDLTP